MSQEPVTLTMRERFDKWARVRFCRPQGFHMDRGEYADVEVQDAWETWQAADESAQDAYGVPVRVTAAEPQRNGDTK